MTFIQLKEAGDNRVLAIASVEVKAGTFGQEVWFTDADGDTLTVPESSVLRQLDRTGAASIPELAGQNIHFSRAASNKPGQKPFWNLDKVRDGDASPKAQKLLPNETGDEDYFPHQGDTEAVAGAVAARYAQPLYVATDFAGLIVKYKQCVAAATEAWGDDTGDEALVAAAATLFIARNQMKI